MLINPRAQQVARVDVRLDRDLCFARFRNLRRRPTPHPMKLLPLLLGGSVAVNAAFVGLFAIQPKLAPPAFRDFFTTAARRKAELGVEEEASAARKAALAKVTSAEKAGIWSRLQSDDLKTLVARLRAAGFSPVVIRAIVDARLQSVFSARMNELVGSLDVPFWKPDPMSSFNNPKFYETQNQIYRDRTRALREILGDAYFAGSAADATNEQRAKYGDIPKAKIDLVQRIADDYAEMASQVKAATNGIMLPEDREKLALLEREKRADLASVLTPAEFEDYEMRNSTITMRMRTAMTLLDASADEFRAIHQVLSPFADILYPSGPTTYTPELSRQRAEAQKAVADQMKSAVGEQRYAEYARATNYEYQNLYRLAQRENIPIDAINRTYDLRSSVIEQSTRINDARMETDARNAALQSLVAETKAKIMTNLGTAAAESYMKSLSWLNAMERGYAIRLSPDGTSMTYLTAPERNRPAAGSTK
jgi:hypothetical protein